MIDLSIISKPSALIETMFVPNSEAKAYCLGRVCVRGQKEQPIQVGEIHHVGGIGSQNGNYFVQTEFFDHALRAYIRFARRLIDHMPLPRRSNANAYWLGEKEKIMAVPLHVVLENPLPRNSDLYQLLCESVTLENATRHLVLE